jgi:gamma-glutamyltranspeptidase
LYQGKDYSHGFLSAPVPSCLKGYEALHKAYGRLPWTKVLQPAIELAENGSIIRQGIIDDIRQYQKITAVRLKIEQNQLVRVPE